MSIDRTKKVLRDGFCYEIEEYEDFLYDFIKISLVDGSIAARYQSDDAGDLFTFMRTKADS